MIASEHDIPDRLIDAITEAVKGRGGVWKRERGDWRFRCVSTQGHKQGDVHPSADWNPGKAVWTCRVCGEHGGAYDLAERLGIDWRRDEPRLMLAVAEPVGPPSLARFCAERQLPEELLREVFEVEQTRHDERPALRYPTIRGDRIRFLDEQKPKYKWSQSGGHETLYNVGKALTLLRDGQDTLYLVNGEPSVWACHAEGVPAFCLCVGEKAPSMDAVAALVDVLRPLPQAVRVAVAYDRDEAGETATAHAIAALTAGGITATACRLPDDLPPSGDVDDLHRRVGARLGVVLGELCSDPVTAQAATVDEHVWQTILADVELFADAPPPYWVERVLQHVKPFATMFPADWAVMMFLPFWGSLWPSIRLQNLNTAVWTLGLGFQSTGKNLVTDELSLIAQTVAHRTTRGRVTLYTSGSIEGMYDALAGPERQLICYQDEFANWLQVIKHRDYMAGIRGVLCSLYDGRNIGHLRAQKNGVEVSNPHVVFCATTTPSAFRQYADPDDLLNGYLSRFLFCAPDAVQVAPHWFPQDDHRRRTLIDELIAHVKRLENVSRAEWQESGRTDPPLINAYAEHLGMNSGRKLILDDDAAEPPLPGGRLVVRAKKIAMLLELAEPSPNLTDDGATILIRPEHVGSAIGVVERGRAYADRVAKWIGQSTDYRLTTKILGSLKRHPSGLTVRDLTRYGNASRRDVEGALKSLGEAGLVSSVKVGRAVKWLTVSQ